MPLRFPCIGDVHLQHGHRRNADRLQALDQIIGESLALGELGAWLVLGDVFHERSSIEDRNDVAPRLQRMADTAPVVMIYGNHDRAGDLHILARLRAYYPIHVLATAAVINVDLPSGDQATIFGVPYPHKAALVAAGVEHGLLGDVAAQHLDAIFLGASAALEAAGGIRLMIGHATLAGAVSSVGQPMGLDRDIAVSAALLERLPAEVPKIFGHIHKPQELLGAYYAGSIGRNDWGECEDKRYLVVEYSRLIDNDPDSEWMATIREHPIRVAALYHVEGELARDGFAWRVTRGPDGEELAPPLAMCPSCQGTGDGVKDPVEGTMHCATCVGSPRSGVVVSWAGVEVRVRYTFNANEITSLDRAQVLATFADAKHLELEPIAIRERAARAPEVAAAMTLPDKVSTFVRMSGIAWTPALEAKLAALQEVDGAAFLTNVQRAVLSDRKIDLQKPEQPSSAAAPAERLQVSL